MTASEEKKRQPLAGLLIVDLTRLLPGPLCTMILGDYGADVIKVEDIETGDPTRFVGELIEGSGSFFRQLNRNKKSIALNLKRDEGVEVIKKLTSRADVLIEGFRPGVMQRLGLGYDELKIINRGLVYTSLSGYGQKGPYRDRAGHDLNYTALTGLLDLSAEKNGPPVMPSLQIADIAAGSLMAINGILMALFRRSVSGEGSYVDIAMTRGLLPLLAYAASSLAGGNELARRGEGYITGALACYNIYQTADNRYMSLGALEPVFWQRFCKAVEKDEWIEKQFVRSEQEKLLKDVKELFKTRTREGWESLFAAIDACCEPILELRESLEHRLIADNEYWLSTVENNNSIKELMTGFPILFSGPGGESRLPPPRHGENSAAVLKELGYNDDEIADLNHRAVIKINNH